MAIFVEAITTILTLSGLFYMLLALWGTRSFVHSARKSRQLARASNVPAFAPGVSILKPVKGVDTRMYAGLVSHCKQQYAGGFEIIFGVSSLDDPAVAEIERLQGEFPATPIRIIECSERLGASGKVTNLVQMLRQARYPYILINDSDIRVSPHYLTHIMALFADSGVGMVTAPYRGITAPEGATIWSRLEALGISIDFLPGVLAARKLEGGIRFGLGSTLAVSRVALDSAGGLEPLVNHLADDYQLGARIAAAGFRVELAPEIVETSVPNYTFRGFWEHQLRWARSTRDSRHWGYLGLGITYCVPWAVLNCIATGLDLWSFSLLSVVLLTRVGVALSVGVGVLNDPQAVRDLWLLPLRDLFGLLVWTWSFASDEVVWRGERFRLRDGHLISCG